LTSLPASCKLPAWTSTSTSIVTMSAFRQIRWSQDGKQIIYWSSRDGNQELYVMNADGSNQTRLTDNPADDVNPDWKP
jgi:Tol biopolymer transport system component